MLHLPINSLVSGWLITNIKYSYKLFVASTIQIKCSYKSNMQLTFIQKYIFKCLIIHTFL
jgi:hypothetical protein